jgi:hypothetical protein
VKIGSKTRTLPDRVQAALAKAYKEDVLEEDDVPTSNLDDVQMEADLKVFMRAFADGTRLLKVERFETDIGKFEQWFRARFSDNTTVQLSGTASKITMTPEFKADMVKQGMENPEDLLTLELAMLLGRAVVPAELANGNHGQPPGAMAGALASVQSRPRGSESRRRWMRCC